MPPQLQHHTPVRGHCITIISCCSKGLHKLNGTHDFRIANGVVVVVEIHEVNATRAIVPLVV